MQQWHQLEFTLKSKYFDIVENYLFDNDAGSVTRIDKSDDIVSITVLYENHHDIDSIIANIQKKFENIIESEINYEVIKDQQWEAAWLYDYDPISIGKNIVVYPNWRQLPQDNEHTYIIVDPSIAFGCGNHETTKMCLEWLEKYVSKDSSVLDYGCGTGVLAIGAVKLGAKYAEGIDIDPNSIESSIKNAQENSVANKTHFSDNPPKQQFDLVVANIFSNVLISLVESITSSLKLGGRLALSGIIENQVDEVQQEFKKYGMKFDKPKQMGQWFLLDGVKDGL
ncbi:50S ribosomal protein L11 methyltransferase [Francisella philomiragia]|uniref:Ribosomal protein L11 methyltransferase n=1 Tax=Francisella philomiragia subsp. philomiragia (strain ATCC 25017 / CCUG 19701 / FSC 153 / O\|nr:50S ribosomal protein L11 methyltransferase [Francisella philomiragia]AJI47951.1 ribosomal protein L11 methyltransferase [Francisella philomiragia]AJI49400.1 ribosomal protein L11 methyltransferase [Francisella philomiragia]MBK2020255.1 50S ribosomal protein L11 methyltransferase [Francisella philomiragia]MBK2031243.1 50S ribosomal protein L11 methyltransferase [Francisella philomiragia]MBK2264169.1 50S ribosomal protein L11 methyltransferase [Francisella philomiragia]